MSDPSNNSKDPLEKFAYTISEIKPILEETKALLASKGLDLKRSKAFKSMYAPEGEGLTRGIIINKRRNSKLPDRSIPDLIHEHMHLKSGHDGEDLKAHLFYATKKSVDQETEATGKALDYMAKTKGKRRADQEQYLLNKLQEYKDSYAEGVRRYGLEEMA